MKRVALIVLLGATPVAAQEAPPQDRSVEQLLRDLFADVEPTLRQFRDAIGNLGEYHAPEVLPNGDILIRRKTPLEPAEPDEEPTPEDDGEDKPEGPIDL